MKQINIDKETKDKILSLLTDKNRGKIDLENDDERFGALMAYSQAFKDIDKLLIYSVTAEF